MTTRTRYFLLQLPSWGLAAMLLAALHHWAVLPLWAAAGAWLLYAAKDFLLFPHLRRAYETAATTGAQRLIGQTAVVTQELAPDGYVRLFGELWQARAQNHPAPLPSGMRVRVTSADGLVLLVSPEPLAGPSASSNKGSS